MTKRIWAVAGVFVALIAGVVLLVVIRNHRAATTLAAYNVADVEPLVSLGTTTSLEILPLVEAAATDSELQTEPGVAYLIRTDQATIMMDFGFNADKSDPTPLEHNMERLGVSLDDVDIIVISHRHPDHVGGMTWWMRKTFSPGSRQVTLDGKSVYVPEAMTYPGLEPVVVDEPRVLAWGVATMGVIPFAQVAPINLVQPLGGEQTLAVHVVGQGIVLIAGCGHPSVETMVARAEALFDVPVTGFVGGIHYPMGTAADVEPVIAFLKERQPQIVAISPHDSSEAVLRAFEDAFPGIYRTVEVGTPMMVGRGAVD